MPEARVIYNPLKSAKKASTADYLELHNASPNFNGEKACVVNLDGQDIEFPNRPSANPNKVELGKLPSIIAGYSYCTYFLWSSESNCNSTSTASFIDPRKRDCRKNQKLVLPQIGSTIAKVQKQGTSVDPGDAAKPWSDEENKSKVGCTKFLKANDGAKTGFLLKTADHAGEPPLKRGGTILLPFPEFKNALKDEKGKSIQVKVINKGKEVDRYNNTGKYTEDGGSRLLFRNGALPGGSNGNDPAKYPVHVVVKYGSSCFVIDDPRVRVD